MISCAKYLSFPPKRSLQAPSQIQQAVCAKYVAKMAQLAAHQLAFEDMMRYLNSWEMLDFILRDKEP